MPRPTGIVAFLFTDLEGSTSLWDRHGETMAAAVRRHDAIWRSAIETRGGCVFKTIGDAFCAAFHTAADALAAAVEGQTALAGEAWPAPLSVGAIRARAAIHVGSADERDGDYFGPTLNRVARLLAAGHGGQTLLSQAAYELTRDMLPETVGLLRDLGEHKLKDLARPEHIYQAVIAGLSGEFPPLRTLESVPNNLPAQLTTFIGREKELREICERLCGPTRLLTLFGAGGTGKTRLSVQVAAEMLDDFADGVWFVELASISDGAMLPAQLRAAIGLRDASAARPAAVDLPRDASSPPADPSTNPMADVAAVLKNKSTLIVLDNCEHVIDAVARATDLLLRSCPKMKILASSRETLNIGGETVYPVPTFAMPSPEETARQTMESISQYDAVRLFLDRAASVSPDFALTAENAAWIAEICYRVDGIPLAIELAAARMRAMSPKQIAGRLDDAFKLLIGGSRTAQPRQQTLKALIEWSYNLLDETERAVFRRLSVFVGGFSLESAEAVCGGNGVEGTQVIDVVPGLVGKSLLSQREQRENRRYSMLETMRQFAHHEMQRAGETVSTADVFLRWAAEFAESIEAKLRGPLQGDALSSAREELDNLHAAIDSVCNDASASAERVRTATRAAAALRIVWAELDDRLAGEMRLSTLLAHPHAVVDPVLRAKMLNAKAALAIGIWGRRVDDELAEALRLARQSDSAREECWALHGLSNLAFQNANQEEAIRISRQALEVCRNRDPTMLASALVHLSVCCRGNLSERRQYALEAVEAARRSGDISMLAAALGVVGVLAGFEGNPAEARRLIREQITIFDQLGYHARRKWAFSYLAQPWSDQDRNTADTWIVPVVEFAEQFSGKPDFASTIFAIGRTLVGQNLIGLARPLLQRAVTLLTRRSEGFELEYALCDLGLCLAADGDRDGAVEKYQIAAQQAETHGNLGPLTYAWGRMIRDAVEHGDFTTAQTLLERAMPLCDERSKPVAHYDIVQLDGLLHLGRGDCPGAAERFRRALRHLREPRKISAFNTMLNGVIADAVANAGAVALARNDLADAAILLAAGSHHLEQWAAVFGQLRTRELLSVARARAASEMPDILPKLNEAATGSIDFDAAMNLADSYLTRVIDQR